MTARVEQHDAVVVARHLLSPQLVRLRLACPGFVSTGAPDEWVGLVVPGQFQSRYYTVRSCTDGELVLDVVLHDEGLVTAWAGRDCVGDRVVLTEPKGSFVLPAEATWLMLVGDLTAMPAMTRIVETVDLPARIWAEVPAPLADYLPAHAETTWLSPGPDGVSHLADTVAELAWPEGPGYFWMAGESTQMRVIRKHLMRVRRLPTSAYAVMGYWRVSTGRQPRAVDPTPSWAGAHG